MQLIQLILQYRIKLFSLNVWDFWFISTYIGKYLEEYQSAVNGKTVCETPSVFMTLIMKSKYEKYLQNIKSLQYKAA